MSIMNCEQLAVADTKKLNELRALLNSSIMDLKMAEKNLKTLVIQNQLDITPTLLKETDTSKQERQHASEMAIETIERVRKTLKNLEIR
jgi:hypothetical protein